MSWTHQNTQPCNGWGVCSVAAHLQASSCMHTSFSWNRLILMHHQRHSYTWPHSKLTHTHTQRTQSMYASRGETCSGYGWFDTGNIPDCLLEQLLLEKCKNRNAVRSVRSMIHLRPLLCSSVHGDTATCCPPHLHARPTALKHAWRHNTIKKALFLYYGKDMFQICFQYTIMLHLKQIIILSCMYS